VMFLELHGILGSFIQEKPYRSLQKATLGGLDILLPQHVI